MSDEPSSPTSAARPSTSDPITADHHGGRAPPSSNGARDKRQRNRRLFNKKREAFLADLMRNTDILVYAELSTIYYMDCSFLRFLMRASVQFILLTPKPAFIPDPPQTRPLGLILGTNLLCLILHAWFSRPEAGEATRGYLHGGLAIDFIGQKGPVSKLHLVLLDLLVLVLQLVNIGVVMVKTKAKTASEGPARGSARVATMVPQPQQQRQDHDFEERGLLRSEHQAVDIELQELNAGGTRAATGATETAENEAETEVEAAAGEERDALLGATAHTPRTDGHIFDAFNSGEIVVADLNLYSVVKEQILLAQQPINEGRTTSATRNGGLTAASFTGTGLNFRMRVGNRIWGI